MKSQGVVITRSTFSHIYIYYKLQWNFNPNPNFFIQENAFESVVCEITAILSRPQLVNGTCFNVDDIYCRLIKNVFFFCLGI